MSNEEIVKEIDEATRLTAEARVKTNEALCHARNVVMNSKGNEEAYNKGLEDGRNEAWELAKKLWRNDAKTNDDIYGIEYFIDIVNEYTPQEALAKLEAYEKEQNEMKVGDVVTVCGEKGIVVGYLCGLEEYEVWMDGYERPQRICKNEIKKTGKHIDIQSILQQIGGTE